jgi:sugar lactone lactonase YvrE
MRAFYPLVLWSALAAIGSVGASTNQLVYSTSWIGNSHGGGESWVQQDIKGMLVTPDGTVYANVDWDEAGREVGVYRNGRPIAMAGHSHGWGYHGGTAIAVNSNYVYFAQAVENEGGGLKDANTWPPKGSDWFGLSRRQRSDITRGAPFPGGKGGSGDTLKDCFLLLNEVPNKTNAGIRGLWADETRVYVSDPFHHQVRVYDANTMAAEAAWPVDRPDQMAMDAARTLWIIQKADAAHAPEILRFATNGTRLSQRISFPAGTVPTALCLDNRGRLLVADDGPNQQVLICKDLDNTPAITGAFGEKGGIYSGTPGHFASLKFNRPMGVGCDSKGSIYVASDGSSGGGGTVLESYTPAGNLQWRLFGLEFVDMADADPGSDHDVFTKEEHFRMDYSRPAGHQWTYRGYTLNRFKFPQDPRLHIWSAGAWVQRIKNRPFLFVNDMYSEVLQVYRFDPLTNGEIAIPSVLFAKSHLQKEVGWPPHQPQKGEWIWRDRDGDGAFDDGEFVTDDGRDAPSLWGWSVDSDGNVWQASHDAGIRKFTCRGLDDRGNPIYEFSSMTSFPMPQPFTRLERVTYIPATDTLYLAGYTAERPHHDGLWKVMGCVLCRYDHWSKGNPAPRWQVTPDNTADGSWKGKPASMTVAGDYVFVVYVVGGRIEVFNADTGAPVGYLKPGPEVGGALPGDAVGWVDIPEGIRAYRRATGEYLLFVEEDWKSKILMYQWIPGGQ